MKTSKEIEQLTEAYRVICNIETKLRDIAKFVFMNYYGSNWRQEINLYCDIDDTSFWRLLNIYEEKKMLRYFLLPNELQLFRKIVRIRNKVCHFRKITEEECKLLKRCESLINRNYKRKSKWLSHVRPNKREVNDSNVFYLYFN